MNKVLNASKAKNTTRLNNIKESFAKNNMVKKSEVKAVASTKGDYVKVSFETAMNIF